MATIFDAESLRPYIRNAADRVGKHRTDERDIARILIEHGAQCAQAENQVIAAVSASMPEANYDKKRVGELQRRLTDHASAGYSLAELKRAQRSGGDRRGGRWGEIKQIDRELDNLHADVNSRSAALDKAVQAWWADNRKAIERIALEEARILLKGRNG